jgi:hypothetical protein
MLSDFDKLREIIQQFGRAGPVLTVRVLKPVTLSGAYIYFYET